jgi:hypothetical protein
VAHSQTDPESIITTANDQPDVAQILYGLSIRGVRAKAIETGEKKGDRFEIVLETPGFLQSQIAAESIESIWNAILDEYARAVTVGGHCYFCQYDVAGLPKPTTCPECGADLDSIAARRAMRDGKRR